MRREIFNEEREVLDCRRAGAGAAGMYVWDGSGACRCVPDVAAHIAQAYPEDQATGFEVGDLRGVFWVLPKF